MCRTSSIIVAHPTNLSWRSRPLRLIVLWVGGEVMSKLLQNEPNDDGSIDPSSWESGCTAEQRNLSQAVAVMAQACGGYGPVLAREYWPQQITSAWSGIHDATEALIRAYTVDASGNIVRR